MNEQEQEVLDNFRKLTPKNRSIAQSNISVALATQENTMRKTSRPAKKTARQRRRRVTA